MNFLPEKLRPGLKPIGDRGPKRVYAKVKSLEEFDIEGKRIGLQAVDADWFDQHGRHIGDPTFDKCEAMRVFAIRLSLAELRESSPVDSKQAAQHQVTLSLVSRIDSDNDGHWFELKLKSPKKDSGEIAAVRICERFDDDGWSMRLVDASNATPDTTAQLNAFFQPKVQWMARLTDFIHQRLPTHALVHEHVVAYDVGQGSAAGIHHARGWVQCYIDLGGGVWPNKVTYPKSLRFCFSHRPLIILTHWHEDHWVSATFDERAFACDWLVPDQQLGPIDFALLLAINHWGGQVQVWPHSAGAVITSGALKLGRCMGSSINDSGLAVVVQTTDGDILFPGDCGYNDLPFWPAGSTPTVLAMAVPHHGGNTSVCPPAPSSVPTPSGGVASRLVYSVGLGDGHKVKCYGHPRSDVIAAHTTSGWSAAMTRETKQLRTAFGSELERGHTRLTPHGFTRPCGDMACTEICDLWPRQ